MKKSNLIKTVAREGNMPAGDAADNMAGAVDQIVRALRNGQTAHLPGLGTIKPGRRWTFRQEKP